jgi:hypothetical protein
LTRNHPQGEKYDRVENRYPDEQYQQKPSRNDLLSPPKKNPENRELKQDMSGKASRNLEFMRSEMPEKEHIKEEYQDQRREAYKNEMTE